MGLIVNKPVAQLDLAALFDQLDIDGEAGQGQAIHFGGPVEQQRGFVLHSRDYAGAEGTIEVGDTLAMSATLDILRDMAADTGPQTTLVALGYAGWSAGQLEQEIAENAWLIADLDPEIIFAPANASKWEGAVRSLGIEPGLLSAEGGRA